MDVLMILRPREKLPTLAEMSALPPPPPLSHDEYAARHGACAEDIAQIERFAAENQLQIVAVDAAARLVRLSGRPDAVSAAFHVDLCAYERGGARFMNHERDVSLPRSLEQVVTYVYGLDTTPLVRTGVRRMGSTSPAMSLSYTAPQLAEIYGYPTLAGAGQCVGMIELDGGYDPADIQRYFADPRIGLPVPTIVMPNANTLSDNPISNCQVVQNIEVIGALVPRAKIVVYSQGSRAGTLSDFYQVFSAAIHDRVNAPKVLVNAWFFVEDPQGILGFGVGVADIAPFEDLFCAAALLGITICSASGSTGALYPFALAHGEYRGLQAIPGTSVPATIYPASSPWHLAVGGTTLDSTGEIVWNRLSEWMDVLGFPLNGGATGGGVSRICPLPSYQAAADVPTARTFCWDNGRFGQGAPFTGRGVPDVAAVADLFTGYQIYFDGAWGVSGGTGVAVPLWAALIAQINEARGAPLGFINPRLYDLQINQRVGVLRTITRGNNGAFEATLGALWNPCCGLGSPNGERLLEALRA
jgi:kumamolisin